MQKKIKDDESVIDDYISARGLERISKKILGYPITGYELAKLYHSENTQTQKIWKIFGSELKNAVNPFLNRFQPNTVIIGGQISKSFDIFGEALQSECEKRNIQLYIEPETSVRTMQGLITSILGR